MAQKNNNNRIVIAFQKSKDTEEPEAKDFHSICCEADIKSIIPMGQDRIHIIVKGMFRSLLKFVVSPNKGNNFYMGDVDRILIPDVDIDNNLLENIKVIRDIILEKLPDMSINNDIPKTIDSISLYLDEIASQLPIKGRSRLTLLKIANIFNRADAILKIITQVAKIGSIEYKEMNESGSDVSISEVDRLKKIIDDTKLSGEPLKIITSEFKRLQMIPQNSSEFQVVFNYVETLASLPWNKTTEDRIDINKARETLDEDHFGLNKVKERILEFLAVRKLAPERKGSILCFVGSYGVGKTSCGQSIAKAMGRKFIRMSLGGVNDEAEIRGHRRTYVGAMPGRIIQMIKKVESNNPVFMLDEVDKLCRNMRGDPASSLLEVLDPEQNSTFIDNYLGIPFDLSKVMFIATVNDLSSVPPALRDRMEIIQIPGYTLYDKINIAQKHLIPKKRRTMD